MRVYGSETYFKTQHEALQQAFDSIDSRYQIQFPDNLWTEHVPYSGTVHYHLPLIVTATGNPAKKWLHIALYRMESGNYELTYYKH
jgi:hypothetical protein